jgi:hypothetical protein
MLDALARAGVEFVVIGGVAGAVHGSCYPTYDLDIAFADHPKNLERLTAALLVLGGDHRVQAPTFTSDTDYGRLDGYALIPGGPGYPALRAAAVEIEVRGRTVRVASLDHLIAMKQPLGRTKDKLMAMEYRTVSDMLRAPRDG